MTSATVAYGLDRYGSTMNLAQCLDELDISERTFRDGINNGRYPKPRSRGKWSTEKIMRAALGEQPEVDNNDEDRTASARAGDDPFVCGAAS